MPQPVPWASATTPSTLGKAASAAPRNCSAMSLAAVAEQLTLVRMPMIVARGDPAVGAHDALEGGALALRDCSRWAWHRRRRRSRARNRPWRCCGCGHARPARYRPVAKPMIWPYLRTGSPLAIGAVATLWPAGTWVAARRRLPRRARCRAGDRRGRRRHCRPMPRRMASGRHGAASLARIAIYSARAGVAICAANSRRNAMAGQARGQDRSHHRRRARHRARLGAGVRGRRRARRRHRHRHGQARGAEARRARRARHPPARRHRCSRHFGAGG